MQSAFPRQEAILRDAVALHGGYAYKMIGDGFQVAFETTPAAICAALEAQRRLQGEPWGETPIRVRIIDIGTVKSHNTHNPLDKVS